MDINVTVQNLGDVAERFNVELHYNSLIDTHPVTLPSFTSTTVTIRWHTTSVDKGNYTISAYAIPVPGETNTENNTLSNGWVIVALIGDITGPDGWPDDKVDIRDIATVARLFGVVYPDTEYDPNCDITGPTLGLADGKIDIRDIALTASHYGETEQ